MTTLMYIVLSTKETLENSIHFDIIESLSSHFDKIVVFCRGKKKIIKIKNKNFVCGGLLFWLRHFSSVDNVKLIYINDYFFGGLLGVIAKMRKKAPLILRVASPWKYELNSI